MLARPAAACRWPRARGSDGRPGRLWADGSPTSAEAGGSPVVRRRCDADFSVFCLDCAWASVHTYRRNSAQERQSANRPSLTVGAARSGRGCECVGARVGMGCFERGDSAWKRERGHFHIRERETRPKHPGYHWDGGWNTGLGPSTRKGGDVRDPEPGAATAKA